MGAFLPLLLAAALVPGFVLGRRAPRPRLTAGVFRLLYWGWLPVVPVALAGAPVASAGAAVLLATAGLAVTAVVASAYARRRFGASADRAAFTMSAFWGNTAWLGAPVTVALLGRHALPAAVLYGSVASGPHNFLVGGTIAASHGRPVTARTVLAAVRRNRYLPATLLGLAWALSGAGRPAVLASAAGVIAIAGGVPGFFGLGLVLARVPLRPDRDVCAALALRLGLSPLLLLAATPLVAVPRPFLLQAGMATGLNTLTFAGEHDLPLRRIAPTIAWGTVLVLLAVGVWTLAA